LYHFGRTLWEPYFLKATGKNTIAEIIEKYEPIKTPKLKLKFKEAGVVYPPKSLWFIVLKQEKVLEVWSKQSEKFSLIMTYPVLAAGVNNQTGPKLRRGDGKVPEGFYKLLNLNPNSHFHLSMKVNYPNLFDLKQAKADNRSDLGGDIFIHGRSISVGCIAVGDEAIEELFVLVNKVGLENTELIIVPYDFRLKPPLQNLKPDWLSQLYSELNSTLKKFSKH
jgi:murein L,D-transpeptidase YafK